MIELPIHKFATLFFILRCTNDAGVIAMVGKEIDISQLNTQTGPQVYDLSLDHNLHLLDKYLHSDNLGKMIHNLHNMDIDFIGSTEGIAGAVAGVSCSTFSWALQVSENN